MHRRGLICVVLFGLLTSACEGPPPTQIVLVVTATPQGFAAQSAVDAQETTADGTVQTEATPGSGATAATPVPGLATFTPLPVTETPAVLQPTPTVRQIQVAEQIFEGGRMFWLQPTRQIWVMVVSREGAGEWYVYEDFFEEGDLEFDPNIVPPDEDFKQPIRGFGRLWRDNTLVRQLLGWATTDEFGFVTRYEYHPAIQYVDGQYESAPGQHVLFSLYGEGLRFIEESSSWRLNN